MTSWPNDGDTEELYAGLSRLSLRRIKVTLEAEFTIFGNDTAESSEDRITSSLSLWLQAVMSADRGHYLLCKTIGSLFRHPMGREFIYIGSLTSH